MILTYMTGIASIRKGVDGGFAKGSTIPTQYTRESIHTYQGAAAAQELELPFEPQTDFGVSVQYRINATGWWNSNVAVKVEDEATGISIFELKSDYNENIVLQEKLTGSSHTYKPALSFWNRFDLQVRINAVDGYIKLYNNNALIFDVTGDTTLGGTLSSVDNLSLSGVSDVTDQSQLIYYGAIFVSNGDHIDTRNIEMYQHQLTGDRSLEMQGDYTDWIDNGAINDETRVISSGSGQTQTATVDALPSVFDSYEVIAVGVDARVSTLSDNTRNLALVVDDGTTIGEGESKNGNGLYYPQKEVFNLSPDGDAWTNADIANLAIGVRSKA